MCDGSGACTMCDRTKNLSLVTDPEDNTMMKCAKCHQEKEGCKLCKDDDNTNCKMCNFPDYSLETDDDGNSVCTKRCMSGHFAKEMTLDQTQGFETMREYKHNVCTACTGDCSECKDESDKCLLCSDDTKFALKDGTCADSCPAMHFAEDGRCHKCGPNTATCEIDSESDKYMALTCSSEFYLHSSGKMCVSDML